MTNQKEVFDVVIEEEKMGNVIESFQVQQYKVADHFPVILLNENQVFSQSLGNNQRIKIRTTCDCTPFADRFLTCSTQSICT